MKHRITLKTLCAVVVTLFAIPIDASDVAKEKRWADQIVDTIMTGEGQWLNAKGHKFLSIYTEPSTEKSLGGVLVIHGIGVHPNWTDVVQPIRTRLPEFGWHTLALQMPILPNEAKEEEYKPLFPEVAPRMEAGIAFLKGKGVKNIVVVAHSMGATMAGYYLATHPQSEIKALVSIGATGAHFKDPKLDYVQSLKKIRKPILDVSGTEDLEQVLKTEKLKADTAKAAGNKNYSLVKIEGANHFLAGKESEVVKAIADWIKQFGS